MSRQAGFTDEHAPAERQRPNPSIPVQPRPKRVVITGGSGKLGRWVVKEMVEHNWEVINVDKVPPREVHPNVKFYIADVTNYGDVVGMLSEVDQLYRGIDAVIHIAAVPSSGKSTNHNTFHTNVTSTYNILEAARLLRVKNIALASSEVCFGIPLYPNDPPSLPITEDFERPESSYALSKWVGEKLAEQYSRWDPETKIVNIRLSNVHDPSEYGNFLKWQDNPWERAWNGFCYIDARDCAQAFRLALEKPLKGAHVFNIANADIAFTQPTAELVKLVYPNVLFTPHTDHPREGLISIKKAREVLGYEPKYDWQTEVKKLQAEGKI